MLSNGCEDRHYLPNIGCCAIKMFTLERWEYDGGKGIWGGGKKEERRSKS